MKGVNYASGGAGIREESGIKLVVKHIYVLFIKRMTCNKIKMRPPLIYMVILFDLG